MLLKINDQYFVTQLTEFNIKKEVKRVLKIKIKQLQQCSCPPKAKQDMCYWWLSILAFSLSLTILFIITVMSNECGISFTWGLSSFPAYKYWDMVITYSSLGDKVLRERWREKNQPLLQKNDTLSIENYLYSKFSWEITHQTCKYKHL